MSSALALAAGARDGHATGLSSAPAFLALRGPLRAQDGAEAGAQPSPIEDAAQDADAGQDTEARDDVPFSELNEALSAARARLTELNKAAEIAKVAGDLKEDLGTTLEENRQLKSALDTIRSDNAALQADLDKATESLQIAEERGGDLEAQLTLAKAQEGSSQARSTKLAEDLGQTTTDLSEAQAELASTRDALDSVSVNLASANQESAVLREQAAADRKEADQLRRELEAVRRQMNQVTASNQDLQAQVGALRTAAGEATDAARLNLIAVENRINEINAALAAVKGDDPPVPADASAPGAGRDPASNPDTAAGAVATDAWVPKVTPARSTVSGSEQPRKPLLAAASPIVSSPALPERPPGSPPPVVSQWPTSATAASSPFASRVVPDNQGGAQQIRATAENGAPRQDEIELASLITELSEERRRRAAVLLADLDVRSGDRGLTMTVPGKILFAVNSDLIEPEAYETLAKVAEIVDLYDDRNVMIVGHTDAVGDDLYNQQLSERRANLVRDYFVREFEIVDSRLMAEGKGERSPITSNATVEGRDANRRVEVIILD